MRDEEIGTGYIVLERFFFSMGGVGENSYIGYEVRNI